MRRINVEITENTKDMNPLIFGHFVEFMRDCIDQGMWAQVLKNRGFDKRKDIPEGVVDGNPEVADGWVRTGSKNTFEIELDAEESLSRDGHAQRINCYNAYDGYVGVAQNDLYLENKEYSGYIWMKASGNVEVEVCVREKEGGKIFSETFRVDGVWKKYEFTFCPEQQTDRGTFEIILPGEGEIWLDSASIMPSDNIEGIWKKVFEHICGLEPPIIRYPGGCFADCYHFEDGIGDIDTRPYRRNRHWGGFTDNSFGTDEFVSFCRRIGCEPMICVNFGSGTPEEAADWVEYCNGAPDTPFGRLRAENGHPEPYGIRYWDIGNEIFGDWEIGHSSAEDYADRYLEFYHAMKAKDESIVFMVCGGDGDDRSQEWNETLRRKIGASMDALCLHMYALKSMNGEKHDNRDVNYTVTGSVKKYEEILRESYQLMNGKSEKKILTAVTEYNLGTIVDSYREQTLEAAVFNAGMLNMFMRNSEKILMCNYSDLVNGWPGGCIVSKNGDAFGTGNYYVLKMYSESGIDKICEVRTDSPVYSTTGKIGNVEPLEDVPFVDLVAGRDKNGNLVLFAVNRSLDEEFCVVTEKRYGEAEVTEICSEKTSDMNSPENMCMIPRTRMEEASEKGIIIRPHSVNRIRFAGRAAE